VVDNTRVVGSFITICVCLENGFIAFNTEIKACALSLLQFIKINKKTTNSTTAPTKGPLQNSFSDYVKNASLTYI
jgi:hypothetical protein